MHERPEPKNTLAPLTHKPATVASAVPIVEVALARRNRTPVQESQRQVNDPIPGRTEFTTLKEMADSNSITAAAFGVTNRMVDEIVQEIIAEHGNAIFETGEKFKALTAKLAKRPGIYDPKGLAAWIGRKKLGKKAFQHKAVLGKEEHEESRAAPVASLVAEGGQKFKDLKGTLAKRDDVRDPSALAAWIGRKKLSKEKFQKKSVVGREHHESSAVSGDLQESHLGRRVGLAVQVIQKMNGSGA